MALDPEFIKKVQERKARREAIEKNVVVKKTTTGGSKGGKRGPKDAPVFRSVSMLSGEETYITGDNAKKRVEDAKYYGS